MDVFNSINYRQPYTSQDYPVLKSLSDNLYIQYSINASKSDLVVRAETCRATPTNRPYDTPQYVFIADGCDKDETIRHYSYGMSSVQRFSMQAFRFLSDHRFVYLHCDLVVCHRYDYNSTCARSTSCSRRYRRDVDQQSEDVSGMYALSFGPVMKGKESADKSAGAHSEASNTTLIGSLNGFGCLSVVLIGALLFMIQRSRRRRSDQTQTGVENKGELSMQNLGYT
ncbi:Hypothetical predicted protein [Paramuricea clavata]|uniref:Uncharacterized protein n=1 Tax=Paramuricea clavata TaxID=317549 RepID=A0A7D9K4V2_PARCT|nr:Hypothetical predicted protein [Paramuricea clavata]